MSVPHLVVDCGDRTFVALVVEEDGRLSFCSHQVRQVVTRYLSADIVWDPAACEGPEFSWDEVAEGLARPSPRSFFERSRRLGLRRLWDGSLAAGGLLLPSPLAVLSTPAASLENAESSALGAAAITLLEALLRPMFASLAGRRLSNGLAVTVIVPSHAGRLARLALRKVFRRQGLCRLRFLAREVAAAMALVGEPYRECLVVEPSASDLHLYRVGLATADAECRVQTLAASTVSGLGWNDFVRRIAATLEVPPREPGALFSAVDRGLAALVDGALPPVELPTSPPSLLTHASLADLCERLHSADGLGEPRARLRGVLRGMKAEGLPTLLLGSLCAAGAVQATIHGLVGGEVPPAVSRMPVLERPARGLASAMRWQREAPGRSVTALPSGALRLDTLGGATHEILAARHLPEPGEERALWRRFRLAAAPDARELVVHLLWGMDGSPAGNSSLCALPVTVVAGAEPAELRLGLRLRRSRRGRRLEGLVEVRLKPGESPPARAFFSLEPTALTLPHGKERG
jgi:hypothetical protein